MKKTLHRIGLLLLACAISGCVEFQEQTMSYRYDKAADELRIFQDYRGIFGGGDGPDSVPGAELSAREQGELESVLEGQRTFFFANWIFEYDREAMQTLREKLDGPEGPELTATETAKLKKLLDTAIANITITNGPFYFGDDGKLCGVQSVKISNWSEIVAEINHCKAILTKEFSKDDDITDADRKAIASFNANPDAQMLRIDGNSFTLRVPMSRASFDKMFVTESDHKQEADRLRAAGIQISWSDGAAIFRIGEADDETTRITLPVCDKDYRPNAIPAVQAAKQEIKKNFDPAAAARGFLLSEPAEH